MGFCVYYRSTRAVTATEAEAINEATIPLCDDPDWVGCEPICFNECLDAYVDGHLTGSSKLSMKAHHEYEIDDGDRIATIHDLMDALCELSRDHQIDWEIGHDYYEGPVGYIRSGLADDKLVAEIDRLSAELEEARKLRINRRQ